MYPDEQRRHDGGRTYDDAATRALPTVDAPVAGPVSGGRPRGGDPDGGWSHDPRGHDPRGHDRQQRRTNQERPADGYGQQGYPAQGYPVQGRPSAGGGPGTVTPDHGRQPVGQVRGRPGGSGDPYRPVAGGGGYGDDGYGYGGYGGDGRGGDGSGPESGNERAWFAAIAGIAVLVVILGLVAVLVSRSGDDVDTAAESTSTTGGLTTTSALDSSTTTLVETTAVPSDSVLAAWINDYTWTEEFVGSGQSLIHRLDLDAVNQDGSELSGRLVESGAGVENQLEVVGRADSGGVKITVRRIIQGQATYAAGDELLVLSGDPAAPSTSLIGLVTLVDGLANQGTYFLPGVGGVTTVEDDDPGETELALAVDGSGIVVVDVNGATSRLDFGSDSASVRAALDAHYGPGTGDAPSPECPNGADSQEIWGTDIGVEFRGGRMIAWWLPPSSVLTTVSGIGIGTPRATMSQAMVVEVSESSLGTEFAIGGDGGLRGLLENDTPTGEVIEMWAGERCIFS